MNIFNPKPRFTSVGIGTPAPATGLVSIGTCQIDTLAGLITGTAGVLGTDTTALTPQFAKLGIGTVAPGSIYIADVRGNMRVARSDSYAEHYIEGYSSTIAHGPAIHFKRSISGTIGVGTATTDTTILAYLYVDAYNAGAYRNTANIYFIQDGAAGATYVPSKISFQTGSNAAGATERVKINNAGNLFLYAIKAGATQVACGAAAGEVWKTASHATLPDNVLMIGIQL